MYESVIIFLFSFKHVTFCNHETYARLAYKIDVYYKVSVIEDSKMKKILIIMTSAILISGCGGAQNKVKVEADRNPTPILVPTPENSVPTITGPPTSSLLAHTDYSFLPVAKDDDNDTLVFSIINQPSWAVFDTSTGGLKGTPTEISTYTNILISVSDGESTAYLPSFDINVLNPLHDITITWSAPTIDMNGDDIENLTGFKIMYSQQRDNLNNTISINDASMTNTLITGLESGLYFFSMTATTLHGIESDNADISEINLSH